uniref:Uncharacterized protein n=1 Tax=Corethron hystrix TaxID=216773 RepID=A0A7S1BBS0_9STRA|mmetsp:Transcript_20503/g.46531  ORF Transcript_20503/g.46531 Transcript_20503/m.46531 type:complete len:172 (+) Transcript_20503:86-601(+)
MIENLISVELLFWLPTLLDIVLLIFTYGYCSNHGVVWFLKMQAEVIAKQKKDVAGRKKKDDDDAAEEKIAKTAESCDPDVTPELQEVWEMTMAAYSAYACLLPLAVYWCTYQPELRPSFCWTMTILMVKKTHMLFHSTDGNKRRGGLLSLIFFYFPTYGGYAVLKTFFASS